MPWGPGLQGMALPIPGSHLHCLWVPWEPWAKVPVCSRGFGLGVGPRPMAPPCWGGGDTLSRGSHGGVNVSPCSPRYVLPDARGPLEVLVGLSSRLLPSFTDFSDFLGRLLVVAEFYSHDYLFTYMLFFQESSSRGITSSIV